MPTYTTSQVVRQLPDILDELHRDRTPMTIVRHNDIVAELHPPADPAEQIATQTRQLTEAAVLLDHITARFHHDLSGGCADMLKVMTGKLHLPTAADIGAFLDHLAEFEQTLGRRDSEAGLRTWDLISLPFEPGDDNATRVARLLFTKTEAELLVNTGEPLGAWAQAIADVHQQARERGDHTTVPLYDGWGDDDGKLLATVLAAGLTPDTFRTRVATLGAQNVRLSDLIDALSDVVVPLDLLAADARAAEHLATLAELGFPADEAVTLLRRLLARVAAEQSADADEVGRLGHSHLFSGLWETVTLLAQAGVNANAAQALHALEWQQAGPLRHKNGSSDSYSLELIGRAADDGLDPGQWMPLLEEIGDRAYGRRGILPLGLLAEAATRKVDLRGWDDNTHARRRSSYQYASDEHGYDLSVQPWATLYGDGYRHIIDLAAAGVSSATAVQAWALFSEHLQWPGPDMVADLIALGHAGLTSSLAGELVQLRRGGATPTVAQIVELLGHGLTIGALQDAKRIGRTLDEVCVQQKLWDEQRGTATEFLTGWWERESPVLTGLTEVRRVWGKERNDHYTRRTRQQVSPLAFEALALLGGAVHKLHSGHAAALAATAYQLHWTATNESYPPVELKAYAQKVTGGMVEEFLRAVHDEVLLFAPDTDSDAARYRHFLVRILARRAGGNQTAGEG